ncbi:MAG TPA: cytochrome C oxidase subunit IV family protein, partial [Polyangiaceae bacterium]
LLALAALSFGLAHVALGSVALPLAMAIALVKAGLVAVFFMGLTKHGSSAIAAIFSAIALVAILIAFVVGDVVTRTTPPRAAPPNEGEAAAP